MKRDWTFWVAPIPPILITAGFIIRAFARSNSQGWFSVTVYAIMWGIFIWKYPR